VRELISGRPLNTNADGVFRRVSGSCMKSLCAMALVFWVVAIPCAAEALSVQALVDRNRISEQESLELRLVMTDGEGEVDVSPIKDFRVAYRGRSSSVRIVNTQMTREIHLMYTLTPLRSGTLVIPSLTVRSGQETVRTDPVTIQVSKATGSSGSGDLLMVASVSEARPWAGQEIAYTFRFLAGTKVFSARYQKPSFDGFTVREADGQKEYSSVVNGRSYTVTEVTYLLTPLRSGSLTIEPGILTCEVADPSSSSRPRSPFGSFFEDPFFSGTRTVTRSVRSEAIPVTVRALPEYKGPGTFSGLMGTFELKASLEDREVRVGDSVTLTLTLEGTGNVPDAPEPAFRKPEWAKVYPDDPEESVTRDAVGTKGRKTFRFALVPVEEGAFTLGPFAYTVFDPKAGEYRELTFRALSMNVLPSSEGGTTTLPSLTLSTGESILSPKKRVVRTGQDILSIRKDLEVLRHGWRMNLRLFMVGLLFPPLVYLGVMSLTRARRRSLSARDHMALRARILLKEAGNAGNSGKDRDTLTLLYRALVSAVLSVGGRAGESLTYDEARDLLGACGVSDEDTRQVLSLLVRIDEARYGGTPPEAGVGRLHEEVSRVVRTMTGRRT